MNSFRAVLKLKLYITLILVSINTYAGEIEIQGGVSPSGRYEIVLLTHSPYASTIDGAPGVVLRDTSTKTVLSSFIWLGDVSDSKAPGQTKAYWNPDSKYVAITIRSGRASQSTDVYAVSSKGLLLLSHVPLPDEFQELYYSTRRPVNGGKTFERWIDARTFETRDGAYSINVSSRINSDNKLEFIRVKNDGK